MITEKIDIWQGYDYKGAMDDGFRPMLTTYLRGDHGKKGLVLILPGGGYGNTSSRESAPVARPFYLEGYHALHLDYSVAPRRHPFLFWT